MFNVVVEHRKRRVWTPRTIAISVGAHLLVLAAVVSAAKAEEREPFVIYDPVFPAEARPKPVKPTPPPPAQPNRPAPVAGQTRTVPQPPEVVPDVILPPDPSETPTDPAEYSGLGRPGQVMGDPPANPPADSSANPGPLRDWREDSVIPGADADVLPQLSNTRDAQRLLERAYPPTLRDAGVTGRTTVVLVIDKNGQVQPGSVEVRETTNDGFREAAVRAAERFRFRPARLNGQPVAVIISIPIDWQIAP